MEAILKTMRHALELLVIMLVSYFALTFLGFKDESARELMTLFLAAIAKYIRSAEEVPIKDYVNE